MKKIISVLTLLTILITAFCLPINASADTITSIEYLDNGDYIETVIEDTGISPLASTTVNKTKTSYYKNSSGTVLWSVSITATFTYNGTTSSCTSCYHSTTAPSSSWTIKSASHRKAGNTATATATATYTGATGSQDYTRSVTIQCSKDGVIS